MEEKKKQEAENAARISAATADAEERTSQAEEAGDEDASAPIGVSVSEDAGVSGDASASEERESFGVSRSSGNITSGESHGVAAPDAEEDSSEEEASDENSSFGETETSGSSENVYDFFIN